MMSLRWAFGNDLLQKMRWFAPCPEALSISMVSEVVTVLDLILNT